MNNSSSIIDAFVDDHDGNDSEFDDEKEEEEEEELVIGGSSGDSVLDDCTGTALDLTSSGEFRDQQPATTSSSSREDNNNAPYHHNNNKGVASSRRHQAAMMSSTKGGGGGSAGGPEVDDSQQTNTTTTATTTSAIPNYEDRKATYVALIVFLVLVLAVILASVAVTRTTKQNQEEIFVESYYDLAARLVEGFHSNARLHVQVLDMLSISLTSSALVSNQVWPFVTVSNFEAQATSVRSILGGQDKNENENEIVAGEGTKKKNLIKYLGVYPRVTKELRKTWEQYTQRIDHIRWVNESLAYQEELLQQPQPPQQHELNNETDLDSSSSSSSVAATAAAAAAKRQSPSPPEPEEEDEDEDEEPTRERDLETQITIQFGDGFNDDDEVMISTRQVDYNNLNVTNDGIYGTNPRLFIHHPTNNHHHGDHHMLVNEAKDAPGPFYPTWQVSPATKKSTILNNINYNIMEHHNPKSYVMEAIPIVEDQGNAIFGGVWNVMDDAHKYSGVPIASLLYPIFDDVVTTTEKKKKEVVAVIDLDYDFGTFFTSVLPPSDDNSIICVVSNKCDKNHHNHHHHEQIFSYKVVGEEVEYLGSGDWHDPVYDDYIVSTFITDFEEKGRTTTAPVNQEYCPWELKIYPTKEMEDSVVKSGSGQYIAAVVCVFLFTCLSFMIYHKCIGGFNNNKEELQQHQESHNNNMARTESKNISMKTMSQVSSIGFHSENKIQGFSPVRGSWSYGGSRANLYPNCTVFFADIAGFSAWSAARHPTQVFTLLETLYSEIDELAQMYQVFKIETIGDCYMAVTGLPRPQPNHALLMAKFASDALEKMSLLTKELEHKLGPGTETLAMRVGLHSGPVTAGVLRGGEMARYQLFGDAVNTAARMQSYGRKNCIHASQETADALESSGKGQWAVKREDKIVAKGRGELQTFWIRRPTADESGRRNYHDAACTTERHLVREVEEAIAGMDGSPDDKMRFALENYRRIGWVVDLLYQQVKVIALERRDNAPMESHVNVWRNFDTADVSVKWNEDLSKAMFSLGNSNWQDDLGANRTINDNVEDQLRMFISWLAYAYQTKNAPFRSFSHACTCLMSADKMLRQLESTLGAQHKLNAWVKFTVLLSAIIGDIGALNVDGLKRILERKKSLGGSSRRSSTSAAAIRRASSASRRPSDLSLLLERSGDLRDSSSASLQSFVYDRTANKYHNSLEIAWCLLMENGLLDLRQCLCANRNEYDLFRQLLVNLLLGSDISSNFLSQQREQRWTEAFGGNKVHLKASSILDHVSLAAQWTHTVQHWQTYIKWNTRFYNELCEDYSRGRVSSDPSADWYSQEILLFERVIIPLADKLQEPNVLGPTGNELYKCATQNCSEWVATQKNFAAPPPLVPQNREVEPPQTLQNGNR